MEEVEHVISILEESKKALSKEDAAKLRELSNQTVHSASVFQDAGSITLAVIIYSLGKIIERQDYRKIKRWSESVKKINAMLDISIATLKNKQFDKYPIYLEKTRKVLTSISINLKPYIQEVLRKASINKASKIYEHGISMGQTAQMLGITQWELSEYSGQKESRDREYTTTLDVKKRALMALEFFS
jgi:hypothetical protein